MSASKRKDKMQEDFSVTVATVIPDQIKLAQSGQIHKAIENLYNLEKQTRQAEDQVSTSKVAIAIVKICYDAKDYKLLNQNLHVLAKRRGQLRTVVQDFVKEAMTYLEHLPKSEKMELLETLRTITEGKMYVEIERARLTKILADIREKEGAIGEAADILQEIQVETFGQMDRKEKADFILEQVRLCLDKKDYIKAQILSNKINKKTLNDKDFQDLKARFYTQMIRYYTFEKNYLEICRSYLAIYDTPQVKENEVAWKQYLPLVVIYICLAPHDNEQSDLLARIAEDKNINQLPPYKKLISLFTTKEIMKWPELEKLYVPEFEKVPAFKELVDGKSPLWKAFQSRVVEHNVRVIAGYYSRITTKRLSQLLALPVEESETYIRELVVKKAIFAKIDRPAGIISFRKRKEANELMNEWSGDISQLLTVLERTCHLINRENMVHKIEV